MAIGYGTGWALTGGYPWYYWGAPAYGGYPYGYGVTTVPALITNEDLVFAQPPPADAAPAAAAAVEQRVLVLLHRAGGLLPLRRTVHQALDRSAAAGGSAVSVTPCRPKG